jgi:hypothetical protein
MVGVGSGVLPKKSDVASIIDKLGYLPMTYDGGVGSGVLPNKSDAASIIDKLGYLPMTHDVGVGSGTVESCYSRERAGSKVLCKGVQGSECLRSRSGSGSGSESAP